MPRGVRGSQIPCPSPRCRVSRVAEHRLRPSTLQELEHRDLGDVAVQPHLYGIRPLARSGPIWLGPAEQPPSHTYKTSRATRPTSTAAHSRSRPHPSPTTQQALDPRHSPLRTFIDAGGRARRHQPSAGSRLGRSEQPQRRPRLNSVLSQGSRKTGTAACRSRSRRTASQIALIDHRTPLAANDGVRIRP